MPSIKNIVFDFGNVLVEWAPQKVVTELLPDHNNSIQLTQDLFRSPTWIALNAGKITEKEAIHHYHQHLEIELPSLNRLFAGIKQAQHPIPGSHELLQKLHQSKQYALYGLTDNVHEIIAYLKKRYTFFDCLDGVVVSAEVGYLKPSREIYKYLLDTHQLKPEETVFIDDVAANITGAREVGIHGIQFENAAQCMAALGTLGIDTE